MEKDKKTKVIMVQGTMSGVGKSLIVAALCRIFRQDGFVSAPFKSQNMALNSFITKEGLEIGRAQAMQAEAAGLEPLVCMNPILLKPTDDVGSQVIVNGKVVGQMRAKDYFAFKTSLIPDIKQAFNELGKIADIIVIEGAGSPAEINLKKDDIVNMGMAAMVDAPVLLVGDIDRGGVFAQLIGTVDLLEKEEKDRVKGLIINKFRGDKSILDPGITMLEDKSQKPVVGVVPYMDVHVEDEDSLTDKFDRKDIKLIDIAVIRLPRISNFTDFDTFEQMEGVSVRFVSRKEDIGSPDLIILPGTKNTIADMKWLRESGLEAVILRAVRKNVPNFGICGGYQMLGKRILDPHGVEVGGEIRGMELLPIETTLNSTKTTTQFSGVVDDSEGLFERIKGKTVTGYEIHMGDTRLVNSQSIDAQSENDSLDNISSENDRLDNIKSDNIGFDNMSDITSCAKAFTSDSTGFCHQNIYGTYIHGFFDNREISKGIIDAICEKKGIDLDTDLMQNFSEYKEAQYDKLADIVREYLDMDAIYGMLQEVKIYE